MKSISLEDNVHTYIYIIDQESLCIKSSSELLKIIVDKIINT